MDGKQFSDDGEHESMISSMLPWSRNTGVLIVLGVLVLCLIWVFFIRHKHKDNEVKPIAVVSALATTRDVPIYLSALGTVVPTFNVTVRTQINGTLMSVPFKEGQLVKAGDLLAQVDPRPYEALLNQYLGNLERDTALLANAQIDLKRYQTLWKQDSVSQQTLATQTALVEQYKGAVRTDEGLIQSTKINLMYCRITSPIDGRIGLRLVDQGNYVQVANATGIAVINTINPITVIFTLPEDNVPEIVPQVYNNKTLIVKAYDRQQNQLLDTGTLLTIDNQIDVTTGTVKLRATFDNKDNKLFPNQFVNAKLLVNTLKKAILVPTAAIQHSTSNDYVYVINNDSTVKVNPVTTGPVSGNETVIVKGLRPKQAVVVEGADKLTDGAKVALEKQHKPIAPVKTATAGRYQHSVS